MAVIALPAQDEVGPSYEDRLACMVGIAELDRYLDRAEELTFEIALSPHRQGGAVGRAKVTVLTEGQKVTVEPSWTSEPAHDLQPRTRKLMDLFWAASDSVIPSSIINPGSRMGFTWVFPKGRPLFMQVREDEEGEFLGFYVMCGNVFSGLRAPKSFDKTLTLRSAPPIPWPPPRPRQ